MTSDTGIHHVVVRLNLNADFLSAMNLVVNADKALGIGLETFAFHVWLGWMGRDHTEQRL